MRFFSFLLKIIDILMHNRINRDDFYAWILSNANQCVLLCVGFVSRLPIVHVFTTLICLIKICERPFFCLQSSQFQKYSFFFAFEAEMELCPYGSCRIGARKKTCAEQITQVDTFLSILLIAIFLMSPEIHHSHIRSARSLERTRWQNCCEWKMENRWNERK